MTLCPKALPKYITEAGNAEGWSLSKGHDQKLIKTNKWEASAVYFQPFRSSSFESFMDLQPRTPNVHLRK